MSKFVPDSISVPDGKETKDFRIRALTINDLVKDYDAVMSSTKHLQGVFGPGSTWPSPDLTLEQDLIGLGWHQKEFQTKSSFAYTVMNPNESRCLGCVYIDPSEKVGYDANVTLWVRKSEMANGLDNKLFHAVNKWLADDWWLQQSLFPDVKLVGRNGNLSPINNFTLDK
jgi:hypothetical protein